MRHLERLVQHLGWADHRVWESLRDAGPAGQPHLGLYAHVLAAETVWYGRLTGTTSEVAVWPSLSLDDCARLGRRNLDHLTAFVASLAPADLTRGVTYTNSAGRQFTSEVEDIVLHVCLHGAYHRGQIASGIRGAGAEPSPTDYIAFARGAPAATRPSDRDRS